MIRDIIPPRVEFDFTKGSLQTSLLMATLLLLQQVMLIGIKERKARSLVFDGAATAINLGNVSDFDNDEVQSFAAVFKTTSNAIQMIAIKSDGAVLSLVGLSILVEDKYSLEYTKQLLLQDLDYLLTTHLMMENTTLL
jgi:hypothetical protein